MSRNLTGTRSARPAVTPPVGLPRLVLVVVMVLEDHDPFGPAAAFFKESMRRDAMIGIKVEFALWDTS